MEDFLAYLKNKKIESANFEANDKNKFLQWQNMFSQMNEKSFTFQVLFEINNMRRKYPIKDLEV